MRKEISITHDELLQLLHYDPETGVFTWRETLGGWVKKGATAGTIKNRRNGLHRAPDPRRAIMINKKRYYTNVLAWFYMTGEYPKFQIDHINGDSSDDKWTNLRLATISQNQHNAKIRSDNNSGYKGVSWHKQHQKWQAYLNLDCKRIYLGYFDCPKQAHAAYCDAANKYFGEFARHG